MGCRINGLGKGEKARSGIDYGCEEFGRLKSVLMHTPGEELSLLNESNYKHWLYDKVLKFQGILKSIETIRSCWNQTGSESMNLKSMWTKTQV